MSLEKALTFADVRRPKRNSVVMRRDRLIDRIDFQLELVPPAADGLEKVKSGPKWWWQDESGTYFVEIRYGKNAIDLGKGKTVIRCASLDAVRAALKTVRAAVQKGELDASLAKASSSIRSGFSRAQRDAE